MCLPLTLSRECKRELVDAFDASEETCPYGYYFPMSKPWECNAALGKCTRMCVEHFEHFKAEIPAAHYHLIKAPSLIQPP